MESEGTSLSLLVFEWGMVMRKQLGWITPFALLALATAGCGSAPADEGSADEQATANVPRAEPAPQAEQAAQPNVGKEESAWMGGWGMPIGFGYGAYGAAYGYASSYATGYAAGYVAPGFLGFPGVYSCGWATCAGLLGWGWGLKDGKPVEVARDARWQLE